MSLRSSRRFDLISLRPNQIVTARLTNSTGMNNNKRLEIDNRFNMVALFEMAAARKISGLAVWVALIRPLGMDTGGMDFTFTAPPAVANVGIGIVGFGGQKT